MNYQIKPLPKLTDSWKIFLALKVVSQLRGELISSGQSKGISIPKMDLKSELPSLIKLLHQEAKGLENIDNINKLKLEKQRLEQYCLQKLIKVQLPLTLNSLRRSKLVVVRSILEIDIKEHRPPEAIERITNLTSELLELKIQAQNTVRQKQILQKQAWEKYTQKYLNNDLQAIIIQILKGLEARVEEEYEQLVVVQLYVEAYQLAIMYRDWAQKSFDFLTKIQTSLEESCIIPTEFSFNTDYPIDIAEEQKLLEIWTGHPVNHWGNCPATWQQVKNKLLENLDKRAIELSQKFCQQLSKKTLTFEK